MNSLFAPHINQCLFHLIPCIHLTLCLCIRVNKNRKHKENASKYGKPNAQRREKKNGKILRTKCVHPLTNESIQRTAKKPTEKNSTQKSKLIEHNKFRIRLAQMTFATNVSLHVFVSSFLSFAI